MKNKLKINKKLILLFTILILIIGSIVYLNNYNIELKENIRIGLVNFKSNIIPNDDVKVKSLDIEIIDGSGPFDADDNPGNDSSANNKIVRSNDQLTYILNLFFENNNENIDEKIVVIEGKLPKKDLVSWDTSKIESWAGKINVEETPSEYLLTIRKKYSDLISNNNVSTNTGIINVPIDLRIIGTKHLTEIQPEFKVYFEGNSDNVKVTKTPSIVTVSAIKDYLITHSLSILNKTTLNNIKGTLIKDLLNIRFKNINSKIKGKEFVYNEVLENVKYNIKIIPAVLGHENKTKDITDILKLEPVRGNLIDDINFSGNLVFEKIEDNKFLQKIENLDYSRISYSSLEDYSKLHSKYYEMFLPFLSEEYIKQYAIDNNIPTNENGIFDYKLEVSPVIEEIKNKISNDNTINVDRVNYRDYNKVEVNTKVSEGRIQNRLFIGNPTFTYSAGDRFISSDSLTTNGLENNTFTYISEYLQTNDKETRPVGTTTIFKFYQRHFDPNVTQFSEENSVVKYSYGVKSDGTDWNDDLELASTNYSNLKWYNTPEEAMQNGKIVSVAVQKVHYNDNNYSKDNVTVNYSARLNTKTQETALIGEVLPVVGDFYAYKLEESKITDLEKAGGDLVSGTFNKPEVGKGFYFESTKYDKEEYNELLEISKNDYEDKNTQGDSMLVVKEQPTNLINTNKSIYNLHSDENIVNVKITPSVTGVFDVIEKKENIVITTTIPSGLNYLGNAKLSGNYDSRKNMVVGGTDIKEESIIKNSDGTTTVKFILNTPLNKEEVQKLNINYDVKIPLDTKTNKEFEFESIIDIENFPKSKLSLRTAKTKISVNNLYVQIAVKDIKQQVIENGEKFEFSLRYLNQGRSELENLKLLDILPYNNDDRGSNFTGTYKINNIRVVTTKDELPVTDNSRIYYTTSTNIRTKEANNFLQDSSINWIEYTGGEISNVTAIYTKGNLEPESKREVTFELIPQNSTTGSIYANKLYSHVDNQADNLNTPEVKGIIAKRTITGKVFKDININGIRESSEQLLSGKTITLLTENGQRVQRVDGTFVDPVTTNSNGEYTFEDVPPLSNMKIKITLDNTEEITKVIADNKANLDGYINNISMLPAINLIENNALEVKRNQDFGITPKISITANKIWVGGPTTNRPRIQLQLYKDGNRVGNPVTVNTQDGKTTTSYTWNNLDITDNTGKYYEYTVDEVNVPRNYTKSLSRDTLTITNTYTVPQISFTGTKKFVGGENARPEFVELKILRDGQEIPGLENNGVKRIAINNSENIYTATWDNLDEFNTNSILYTGGPGVFVRNAGTNGEFPRYNYTVEEINVPTNYRKTFENNNKTVVNTYVSPKTSFKASKVWVNGEDVRPNNIKLQLYRNSIAYKEPVIVSKESNTAIWNDLDLNDETGNLYTYTVDELEVPNNFVKTLSNVTKTQNVNNQTITNTYSIPKVNITGTKNWVGGENVRPDSIKLQLYKDGQPEGEAVDLLKTESSKTWENLPKTDSRGKNFVYTVDEVEVVDNFVKKIVNTSTGSIITNTFESPKTDITVTKNWVNGEELRKDIQIQLLRNGQNYKEPVTIKKDSLNNNTGTYTFTNLDKMDNTGTNYTYTAKEITAVENFVKRENGLNITNEYQIPKIDINVNKKWKNWYANKEKPEYGIQLYKDEQPVGNVIMLKEDTYTFTNLDKTDITGREYNYEVKEVIVPKYFEKTETKISNTEHELVNIYIPPVMEVYVNKVWVNGNQENRPEIEFVLYGNTTVVASAKLENGQTSYIFKDIPKFDNEGEEIAYMIKEKINEKEYIAKNNIKYDFKYDSSIEKIEVEDDLKQVFEATNEYIIPKTKFNVRKLWVGDNKENRPSIQIQLYQNGMKYKEPITLTKDEIEYTWEDLDATNKYQEEYVYTADEVNVPNGYDKKVLENGAKIINIKKTVNGYLPFAGLKENTQIGIVLILIASIVYLRNSKKNYITANKRTKLSNMNIRRKK